MADGHGEAVAVAELGLQAVFPGSGAGPVAAAAVGEDEQLGGVGVAAAAVVVPPSDQVVDCEVRGVVAGADEQAAVVGGEVVDAVGQGDAFCVGGEVVVVDQRGFWLQVAPGFLKLPTSSRFLESMLMIGRPRSGEGLALGGDVGELGVAAGVFLAGELLVVDPQPVVEILEELGDGVGADVDADSWPARWRSSRWCGGSS